MKLVIDAAIFDKFPELMLGVVVVSGADNSGQLGGDFREAMDQTCLEIQGKYVLETLSQEPTIQAWRKAYSAFGGKPKENKSSVESLYRQVLQGKGIRSINKLVDIYNYISLAHMLPVGGEDLDKVCGDIRLTFAGQGEAAVMLLGDREERAPHPGEVIYKDDISSICRRWNWREADRTKLTAETKNCILVSEALPPVGREELLAAVNQLAEMARQRCGGECRSALLDAGAPETSW
jgi:DNA/RNA-binding domain of Phe-tRNA-synthetase-like protein